MTYTKSDKLHRNFIEVTFQECEKDTGKPIKGKYVTYKLRPLRDRHISMLDNWVRQQHIKIVVEATKELDEDTKQELRNTAMLQTTTMSFVSHLGASIMQTPDGVAKLLQAMALDDHPDLEHEELRAMMFNPANVDKVWKEFKVQNNTKDAPGGKSQPLSKAAKKKRTKKKNAKMKKTSKSRKKRG